MITSIRTLESAIALKAHKEGSGTCGAKLQTFGYKCLLNIFIQKIGLKKINMLNDRKELRKVTRIFCCIKKWNTKSNRKSV